MENVNKLINESLAKLKSSQKTFADVYDVMFSHGQKVFLERDEGLETSAYTYDQVKTMVESLAVTVHNLFGSGNYIGLDLKSGLEWIVTFWAILKSGNNAYLINSNLTDEQIKNHLKILNVKSIVCERARSVYGDMCKTYGSLIDERATDSQASVPFFGNEIALSSSGTSASEKLCLYSGKEISNQILNSKFIVDNCKSIKTHYKGQLKVLLFLPLYHVFGLMAGLLWFSFFGRTFVELKDYSATSIINTINKYRVTHVFAVPLLWQTIEKSVIKEVRALGEKTEKKFYKGLDLSVKLQSTFGNLGKKMGRRLLKRVTDNLFGEWVSFCITGGSYIAPSTLKLINGLGYELHNGYGMTETGITSFEMSANIKKRLTDSIGKPFPSLRYKVDDDGVLLVGGDSVCKKIVENGKLVSESEYYYTGDVVKTYPDGSYSIVGRRSDVVIGDDGENVNPDGVEQLFNVEKATDFCIMGDEQNKKLVAVVRLKEGVYSGVSRAIYDQIQTINKTLPTAKRVSKVLFTYQPLKSENAIKTSRTMLKKAISSGEIKVFTIEQLESEKPVKIGEMTEIGSIIAQIFAQTLSITVDKISYDSNFFTDLGGTSLDYFNLISSINERFSIEIKYDYEQLAFTVADIEKVVEKLTK
ncbi:MAG: AMP-binding protein [Clostridia bacterium]|nr:AMP-binding protein [Clostridia bacterium]